MLAADGKGPLAINGTVVGITHADDDDEIDGNHAYGSKKGDQEQEFREDLHEWR